MEERPWPLTQWVDEPHKNPHYASAWETARELGRLADEQVAQHPILAGNSRVIVAVHAVHSGSSGGGKNSVCVDVYHTGGGSMHMFESGDSVVGTSVVMACVVYDGYEPRYIIINEVDEFPYAHWERFNSVDRKKMEAHLCQLIQDYKGRERKRRVVQPISAPPPPQRRSWISRLLG